MALGFAVLAASALVLAVIVIKRGSSARASLRIACANDAAGMIAALAAEKSGGVEIAGEAAQTISFLKLLDCCGAHAEFALEAGEFDMAVLCPDAAEKFLENDRPFVVAGEIIKNANVLVSKKDNIPVNVGCTAGRALQGESAVMFLGGGINLMPMAPAALPYALEKGAVDAIVLDILAALKLDAGLSGLIITPLPQERATSVLVVNKDIIGAPLFNNFLNAYNECVDNMDEEALAGIFENRENISNAGEKAALWKKLGATFINIPKSE